ncbi:DUF7146 domain-containing protein [Erythrobacter donghaensis]
MFEVNAGDASLINAALGKIADESAFGMHVMPEMSLADFHQIVDRPCHLRLRRRVPDPYTEDHVGQISMHAVDPVADLFDGAGAVAADPQEKRDFNSNARRLWRSATAIPGTPVEVYLAQRGILRASDQLRYLQRTPLGPRGAVQFLPAMLAAVTTDVGVIAVHRTFLDPGSGRLAGFERPKRALGSLGCGAVRLAPPAAGRLGLPEQSRLPVRAPFRLVAAPRRKLPAPARITPSASAIKPLTYPLNSAIKD